MKPVKKYFSLVKFSHSVFAMPFALIGFFSGIYYGKGQFSWNLLAGVVLCMVFARTAAMAFNRYLDRDIDKKNPRTSLREIPAGLIKADSALWLIISCVIGFVATTFFINTLVFALSPVALIVILGYSYTKRFTSLSHFVLGLGLSLAPIGAYLAVTGKFAFLPILYSLSVLLWTGGFDILYALQDEEFDRKENLFSIPVLLGRKKAMNLSSISHVFSIIILVIAGIYASQGVWYWSGIIAFSGLMLYQHMIISVDDLRRINMAFATTNGFASIIFSIFAITDMLL